MPRDDGAAPAVAARGEAASSAAKAIDTGSAIESSSTPHAASATRRRPAGSSVTAAGPAAAAAAAPNVQLSKKLSWLLRHGADKEGLKLGRGGYACLGDVVCFSLLSSFLFTFPFLGGVWFDSRVVLADADRVVRRPPHHTHERATMHTRGNADLTPVSQLASRTIRSLTPRPALDAIRALVRADPKGRFALVHMSRAPVAEGAVTDPTTSTAAAHSAAAATNSDADTNTDSDTDPAHYLIRANQGHSLAVEETDLLTPLSLAPTPAQQPQLLLPPTVVHGTRHAAWTAIVASGGLRVMGRRHVHFAREVPRELHRAFGLVAADAADAAEDGALGGHAAARDEKQERHGEEEEHRDAATVVSGMRNSSSILIWLDLPRALAAGVPFWLSANGVVLGGGGGGTAARDGDNVAVPLAFFEEVRERGGRVLVRDGVVVAAPERPVAQSGGRTEKEAAGGRGGANGRRRGRGGRGGQRGG